MFTAFLEYLQAEKRYSVHTIRSYELDLSQFHLFLQEQYSGLSPQDATFPIIRTWLAQLAAQQYEPKSIQRKIACLRSYFKFLQRKGQLQVNPMIRIKAPKAKKRLPVFVEEQNLQQLLLPEMFCEDWLGRRDKLVMELLYGTGIRLSELLQLQEKDIQLAQAQIKVLGKGNKQRIIPLHPALVLLISQVIADKKEQRVSSPWLVNTEAGEQAYPMLIYRIVKEYLSKITTIEKKSPHVLRHSFATHLLNKGAELNAIKDLLGHSSLAATQVYTHNSLEQIKQIFKQAHPKA
ncbi:MAG: tyrosine-type recombinase/integrase [Cytophagaceae bacterium]|jgi:integrase/recombinase XerC|nr:tyrosine-type recombinase/integrase [Cytophagaceae bacterium]